MISPIKVTREKSQTQAQVSVYMGGRGSPGWNGPRPLARAHLESLWERRAEPAAMYGRTGARTGLTQAPGCRGELPQRCAGSLGAAASELCTWRGSGRRKCQSPRSAPAALSQPRLRVPLPRSTWPPRPSYWLESCGPATAEGKLARALPSRTPRRGARGRRACWHGRTAGPRRPPPTTRSPSLSWTSWIRRNSPALRSRPCALLPGKPRKVWQRPKRGRTPA